MAVRPIDANELYRIEKLLDTDIVRQDKVALNLLEQVLYDIQHVPTLTPPNDFTPVQHGRWVKPVPGDGENYCSVCHAVQPWFYGYGYYDSDYCPNCGACMDAKEALKDGKND